MLAVAALAGLRLLATAATLAWEEGGDVLFAVPSTEGRRRVGLDDPVTHALRIAQFRDSDAHIGCGIDDTEPESWHSTLLPNPTAWQQAAAGLPLAAWGKAGPHAAWFCRQCSATFRSG